MTIELEPAIKAYVIQRWTDDAEAMQEEIDNGRALLDAMEALKP